MSLGKLHTHEKVTIHAIVNQILAKQSENLKESICYSYPKFLIFGFYPVFIILLRKNLDTSPQPVPSENP